MLALVLFEITLSFVMLLFYLQRRLAALRDSDSTPELTLSHLRVHFYIGKIS